jgi:EAL domain-containing protein (putative c-di-GMP-specific phosphodiesterase class I)
MMSEDKRNDPVYPMPPRPLSETGKVRRNFLDADSRQRIDPKDDTTFRARLKALRELHNVAPNQLVAGSLQILGFDELAKRFGPKWPALRDKAHFIAVTCIERELAPADFYVPLSDEHYMLVFFGLTQPEADAKARRIAQEIANRLVGERSHAFELITVRSIAVTIDAEGGLTAIGSIGALAALTERVRIREEDTEAQRFAALADEIEVAWHPTVNLGKRLLSAYEGRVRKKDGGPLQRPSAAAGVGRFEAELDAFALAAANTALVASDRLAHKTVLVVPVHFDTLSDRQRRDAYVAACRTLPANARRRLVVQLISTPAGVPNSRLRQLLTVINPFTLGAIFTLPLDSPPGPNLAGLRILGAAVDATSFGDPNHMLITALTAFARACRTYGMQVWVRGVASPTLAATARKIGIDYLNGPAFLREVGTPGPACSVRN